MLNIVVAMKTAGELHHHTVVFTVLVCLYLKKKKLDFLKAEHLKFYLKICTV